MVQKKNHIKPNGVSVTALSKLKSQLVSTLTEAKQYKKQKGTKTTRYKV